MVDIFGYIFKVERKNIIDNQILNPKHPQIHANIWIGWGQFRLIFNTAANKALNKELRTTKLVK